MVPAKRRGVNERIESSKIKNSDIKRKAYLINKEIETDHSEREREWTNSF